MAVQIIDANQDVQLSTLVDPAYRASAGAVEQDAGKKSRAADPSAPALARALAHVHCDRASAVMEEAMGQAGLSERSLRRRGQAQIGIGWDE